VTLTATAGFQDWRDEGHGPGRPILKYPILRSAQTLRLVNESQYAFASRSLCARLVGLSGGSGGRVRGTNGARFRISSLRKRLGWAMRPARFERAAAASAGQRPPTTSRI